MVMITISTMEKIVTALSTVGNERMFDRLMLPESRPADEKICVTWSNTPTA